MSKIKIVYWTQSGNTLAMANSIAEGIAAAGKEAEVFSVNSISPKDLQDDAVFALGSPAMGAEVIEESEMEPFVEAVEQFSAGKHIALFGSYGWGDGEWMRDWTDRMNRAGAKVIDGEGLICNETPDEKAIEECRNLGKMMASI